MLCREFGCIEKPLRNLFRSHAVFVAKYPWPFVAVSLLLTAVSSLGLVIRRQELDAIYLFTPRDAPSKTERKVLTSLFPVTNGRFHPDKIAGNERRCVIVARASDDGDILRRAYGAAVEELNQFVVDGVKVNDANGTVWGYKDLCMQTSNSECWTNGVVRKVNELRDKFPKNLTYPKIFWGNRFYYLASALGSVKFKPGSSRIASAKSWQLTYQLQTDTQSGLGRAWEQKCLEKLKQYRSDWLTLSFAHSETLNEEMHRNVDSFVPKFAVTFFVLIVFSVLSTTSFLDKQSFMVDWVVSKPMVAMAGVFTAGMGVVTGMGLLCLCGYVFADVVTVVPPLLVSICAEYMFLMNGAWRRTNRCCSVEERLGESVSIHAVSIVIAMFTGALAFAVGAITTIPGMQMFCVHSAMSMLFAMVYQFTFFLAILAVFGRLESEGRNGFLLLKTVPEKQLGEANVFQRLFNAGSQPCFSNKQATVNYTTSFMDNFFEHIYAPFLMHPVTKCLVMLLLVVYLATGLWGCMMLKQGLRPVNLVPGDSYAVEHYNALENYMLPYGQTIQVVVGNASAANLATKQGRFKMREVISAFTSSEYIIGEDSVQYFMDDFLLFLKETNLDYVADDRPEDFYHVLRDSFLRSSTYQDWNTDLVWHQNNGSRLDVFRFLLGARNLTGAVNQIKAMSSLRRVASKYPELNITTFAFYWLFADQYRMILPNTLENISIALVLMVLISCLLIPHPLCAVCVAVMIVSIDIGVVGYMTFWEVSLDTISMVTIIMSVGFSVDFTAHVSYGYVVLSVEEDPVKRMQITLGARGWPVLQACLATILGILVLSGVNAYIIITFFKTVTLVMVLGLLHAIVFLPVLLDLLIRPVMKWSKRHSQSSSDLEKKHSIVDHSLSNGTSEADTSCSSSSG